MTIQMIITPGELERQANLCYEGKMMRVFLCYDVNRQINVTDSVGEMEELAVEGGDGGYEDFTIGIPTGYYNVEAARYEIPPVLVTFGGVEQGFTYDTLVVQIGSSNYPHSVIRLSEAQTLSHGQLKTYRISLLQDD